MDAHSPGETEGAGHLGGRLQTYVQCTFTYVRMSIFRAKNNRWPLVISMPFSKMADQNIKQDAFKCMYIQT